MARHWWIAGLLLLLGASTAFAQAKAPRSAKPAKGKATIGGDVAVYDGSINATPKLHPIAEAGANWLIKTQQADGGWPTHRLAILPGEQLTVAKSDYSTSAMAGLALIRAGASPTEGSAKQSLRKAIEYVAAEAPKAVGKEGGAGAIAGFTDMGSQPSYKLGPLAGPANATQFLARALPMLREDDELREPVLAALEATIAKLENSEHAFLRSFGKAEDGSFSTTPVGPAVNLAAPASFSPTHHVLIVLTALETAQAAGVEVDPKVVAKLRAMLGELVDPRTGAIDLAKVMSIELYSFSSAMRSTAIEARAAIGIAQATPGKVKADTLQQRLGKTLGDDAEAAMLVSRIAAQQALVKRLAAGDNRLMMGFGSHGGEEFLSYLLMSEAFVLNADPALYATWKTGLADRLARVQNRDGSWTGLHCITDPVYTTAAAVQAMTAERDEPLLVHIAKQQASALTEKSPSEK